MQASTQEDLVSKAKDICSKHRCSHETLPQIPFLNQPQEVQIENVAATYRNVQLKDLQMLYETFSDTAEKGIGYTIGHFPTYDYFRFCLREHFGLMVEDTAGEFIGYVGIPKTKFTRSINTHICGGNLILNTNYRGKHIGESLMGLHHRTALKLGYVGTVGESLAANVAMLEVSRKLGSVKVGSIPCVDVVNAGSVDSIVFYTNFT